MGLVWIRIKCLQKNDTVSGEKIWWIYSTVLSVTLFCFRTRLIDSCTELQNLECWDRFLYHVIKDEVWGRTEFGVKETGPWGLGPKLVASSNALCDPHCRQWERLGSQRTDCRAGVFSVLVTKSKLQACQHLFKSTCRNNFKTRSTDSLFGVRCATLFNIATQFKLNLPSIGDICVARLGNRGSNHVLAHLLFLL